MSSSRRTLLVIAPRSHNGGTSFDLHFAESVNRGVTRVGVRTVATLEMVPHVIADVISDALVRGLWNKGRDKMEVRLLAEGFDGVDRPRVEALREAVREAKRVGAMERYHVVLPSVAWWMLASDRSAKTTWTTTNEKGEVVATGERTSDAEIVNWAAVDDLHFGGYKPPAEGPRKRLVGVEMREETPIAVQRAFLDMV
jgi:hypothetical protein